MPISASATTTYEAHVYGFACGPDSMVKLVSTSRAATTGTYTDSSNVKHTWKNSAGTVTYYTNKRSIKYAQVSGYSPILSFTAKCL